jgi:hypothetical protein
MKMTHDLETDIKVKHFWGDGGNHNQQEWNDEGRACMKEELNDFISELKDMVNEFRISPEEAAADILSYRGWKVFSEHTWKIREAELTQLLLKIKE